MMVSLILETYEKLFIVMVINLHYNSIKWLPKLMIYVIKLRIKNYYIMQFIKLILNCTKTIFQKAD